MATTPTPREGVGVFVLCPCALARSPHGHYVYDAAGKRLSHDVLYERAGVRGLWSCELTCVTVSRQSGLKIAQVFHQHRAQEFWKTCLRAGADSADKFAGRILVIAWLHDDR